MHRYQAVTLVVALLALATLPMAANGASAIERVLQQTEPIVDDFNRPNERLIVCGGLVD